MDGNPDLLWASLRLLCQWTFPDSLTFMRREIIFEAVRGTRNLKRRSNIVTLEGASPS